MNEVLKMKDQLILIAFGAFIGLIPGVLVKVVYDSISKSQKKKEVLNGFISELKELKFQYLMNIFLVYTRYSMLDREKIVFLLNNLNKCQDYEDSKATIKKLNDLNNTSDPTLSCILEVKKIESQGKSLIPKKTKILFIEQNLHAESTLCRHV